MTLYTRHYAARAARRAVEVMSASKNRGLPTSPRTSAFVRPRDRRRQPPQPSATGDSFATGNTASYGRTSSEILKPAASPSRLFFTASAKASSSIELWRATRRHAHTGITTTSFPSHPLDQADTANTTTAAKHCGHAGWRLGTCHCLKWLPLGTCVLTVFSQCVNSIEPSSPPRSTNEGA